MQAPHGLGHTPINVNLRLQRTGQQIHQGVFLQLGATQTTPGPATAASKRISLSSDNDVASPRHARLELLKQTAELRREADKNIRLADRGYRKDHDCHDRFAAIFCVGYIIF